MSRVHWLQQFVRFQPASGRIRVMIAELSTDTFPRLDAKCRTVCICSVSLHVPGTSGSILIYSAKIVCVFSFLGHPFVVLGQVSQASSATLSLIVPQSVFISVLRSFSLLTIYFTPMSLSDVHLAATVFARRQGKETHHVTLVGGIACRRLGLRESVPRHWQYVLSDTKQGTLG